MSVYLSQIYFELVLAVIISHTIFTNRRPSILHIAIAALTMLAIYSPTIFSDNPTVHMVLSQLRPVTLTLILFGYMRICLPKIALFQALTCSILFVLGSIVVIGSAWGVLAALNIAVINLTYIQLQIISSATTIAAEALIAAIIVRKRIFAHFEFSKDIQIFTILGFALLLVIYSRVNDMSDILKAGDWLDIRNYYLFPLCITALTIPIMLTLLNAVRKKQDTVAKFEMESYYRDMELKSLDSFNEVYGELQILRHDFNNHVLALRQISEENKDKKLQKYLALIDPIYMRASTIVQTSDKTFDAILNAKTVYAIGNGIKMDLSVKLPAQLPFDTIEAASLLGNLIDNAIEACERVKEKTPSAPLSVRIHIAPQNGHICIKIDNTAIAPRLRRKRYLTSKDNRKYGFGMEQIDRIVNLHNGRVYRKFEDGTFSTTIFIPLPESETATSPRENTQKAEGAGALTAASSPYSPLP